jgi:hypothetical protein
MIEVNFPSLLIFSKVNSTNQARTILLCDIRRASSWYRECEIIPRKKTYWRKLSDEWDVCESGCVYGGATMYEYMRGEKQSWEMTIYHVDSREVLKRGPVELGLHQVEV